MKTLPTSSSRAIGLIRGSTRIRLSVTLVAIFGAFLLAAFTARTRAEAAPPEAPVDSVAAPDSAATGRRILAYYFHTTQRCASCRKIEAYTHEAIENGFASELKDGRLVFRVINVEEKGNEHFVKDYQLFTKSVVLVAERTGTQTAWRNLPKIWELLNNKTKFIRYVQGETRAYLSGQES